MTQLIRNFWDTAYKQNIGKMIGICYRYVRNRQVAEDLAHDAFLNAIDKVSDFEGRGHFEGWLRKIAVNEALQFLREQKKKEYHNQWIQYETEAMAAHEEEEYAMNFTEEELLDAIAQLPEHHRMVFNLFVIDKFNHADIAQALGISDGTSKSHLARARKKIRALLLQKDDKKKRVFAIFLPIKLWNIDKTYQKTFYSFEIQPTNLLKIDAVNIHSSVIPAFNQSLVGAISFFNSGLALGSLALSVVAVLFFLQHEPEREVPQRLSENAEIVELIKEKRGYTPDSNAVFNDTTPAKTNQFKNNDSVSATIVDNTIIDDVNNLNNTEMKRLSTVGALLMAGASMGFDSSKNQELKFGSGLKLPEIQFGQKVDGLVLQKKEGEGTFNASKIFWSSKNHNVYMKGIGMRANFAKDKFSATGTVSFLGEVHYLLIDGEEVQLDKDIKLSDSQYSVKALSIKESIQKYGEKGKNGAVEIRSL